MHEHREAPIRVFDLHRATLDDWRAGLVPYAKLRITVTSSAYGAAESSLRNHQADRPFGFGLLEIKLQREELEAVAGQDGGKELTPIQEKTIAVDRIGRVAEGATREAYPSGATTADGWSVMRRVGKKNVGRTLDGVIHDARPGPDALPLAA